MNKYQRTRLGSFEQLESRALLAHAGLSPALSFAAHDNRPIAELNRGPRNEMNARSSEAFEFNSFGGPHLGRGDADFRGGYNAGYNSNTSFVAQPTMVIIPVIIIVTLPPPAVAQVADSLSNAERNETPSRLSSLANSTYSPSQVSPPTPSRIARPMDRSLDPLSVFSDLDLKRLASTDSQEANEPESTAPATQDGEQEVRKEQESQQRTRPETNDATLQAVEVDEETDLIELDPEELLKRNKRKFPPAAIANREPVPARDFALQLEQRLPRSAELPLAGVGNFNEHTKIVVAPINDDLIELLATEQTQSAPVVHSSQPFSVAQPQLEATLGIHQAEVLDAAIPVEAQPAAVAAAALPARDAQ